MNEDIRKLKWLIEEYEDLCNEAEEMSNPRDQYMKGMEIEEKYNEIKGVLNAL
jgi:hypothetical protein